MASSSSLSSVVSGLVRASMGTSVPSTVKDDDLDRAVAELIVREAKKKAERYGQQGIRAYISSNLSDSNAPRPNKRFLSSIIKSTDDHNKTVLKAQALAAQEIKREREEQERRQRRARAEEASEAEKLRRSGRGSKRKSTRDEESWDRWDGRTAERKKVSRNWEDWDGRDEDSDDRHKTHKRRRSRSRSPNNDAERKTGESSRTKHVGDDTETSRRRRRSRSASPRRRRDDSREGRHTRRRSRERSHRHSRRSPSPSEDSKHNKGKSSHSPKYALDDIRNDSVPPLSRHSPPSISDSPHETQRRRIEKSRQIEPRSPSPRTKPSISAKSKAYDDKERVASPSRSSSRGSHSRTPSPGPHPPIQLPSKMDRYFEESYDPRLDVAPLAAPTVPATGLINNAEFEGWDAMLELIRARREDKAEKKRLERLGLLPPKEKTKKKGVIIDSAPAVADRWTGDGVSVMDIEYKKRGSVREWDMGKEAL